MICKVVQSKMSLIISRCLLRASSQCDWSYAAVNAAAACATAAAAACATAAAASSQNCRKMSSSVGRTDQPGTYVQRICNSREYTSGNCTQNFESVRGVGVSMLYRQPKIKFLSLIQVIFEAA